MSEQALSTNLVALFKALGGGCELGAGAGRPASQGLFLLTSGLRP
jgi:hypothetical protein